jgi:hypothetical protein
MQEMEVFGLSAEPLSEIRLRLATHTATSVV